MSKICEISINNIGVFLNPNFCLLCVFVFDRGQRGLNSRLTMEGKMITTQIMSDTESKYVMVWYNGFIDMSLGCMTKPGMIYVGHLKYLYHTTASTILYAIHMIQKSRNFNTLWAWCSFTSRPLWQCNRALLRPLLYYQSIVKQQVCTWESSCIDGIFRSAQH